MLAAELADADALVLSVVEALTLAADEAEAEKGAAESVDDALPLSVGAGVDEYEPELAALSVLDGTELSEPVADADADAESLAADDDGVAFGSVVELAGTAAVVPGGGGGRRSESPSPRPFVRSSRPLPRPVAMSPTPWPRPPDDRKSGQNTHGNDGKRIRVC